MLTRIDWLDICIARFLEGRKAPTPYEWGSTASITSRDVDLIRQSAHFITLRPGASDPAPGFIARLRERMLAEVDLEE